VAHAVAKLLNCSSKQNISRLSRSQRRSLLLLLLLLLLALQQRCRQQQLRLDLQQQ
jgi:hypothetical protein